MKAPVTASHGSTEVSTMRRMRPASSPMPGSTKPTSSRSKRRGSPMGATKVQRTSRFALARRALRAWSRLPRGQRHGTKLSPGVESPRCCRSRCGSTAIFLPRLASARRSPIPSVKRKLSCLERPRTTWHSAYRPSGQRPDTGRPSWKSKDSTGFYRQGWRSTTH
ncbi:hypothetical protein D9M69_528800 [compost metagenome]